MAFRWNIKMQPTSRGYDVVALSYQFLNHASEGSSEQGIGHSVNKVL